MRYLSRLISLLVMGTVALTPVKSQAQTPNPTSPEGDPLELSGEALDPLTRQALDQFNQGQTTEALATLQQALDLSTGQKREGTAQSIPSREVGIWQDMANVVKPQAKNTGASHFGYE